MFLSINLAFSPKEYAKKIVDRASSIDVSGVKQSISNVGSKIGVYLSDLQVILDTNINDLIFL